MYSIESINYIPKSYDDFTVTGNRKIIDSFILKNKYLFIGSGNYYVDNPIYLNESDVLFLHGIDRTSVRLIPKNDDQPLFIINGAAHVNFSNIRMIGGGKSKYVIRVEGAGDALVELQDCFIDKGLIEIAGASDISLQNVYMNGNGRVGSQIILDHRDANLSVLGGNITNTKSNGKRELGQHIWVKKGHLRMVGTGLQRSTGYADIRIDSGGNKLNPHLLLNIRSEGNNGLIEGGSAFVYIPKSSDDVFVDIINSAGSWFPSGENSSSFVLNEGLGNVRLIGNSSIRGVGSQDGIDDKNIISFANIYSNEQVILNNDKDSSNSLNFYANRDSQGKYFTYPHFKRFPHNKLLDKSAISLNVGPLEYLDKPSMKAAISQFLDVKVMGAKGDGKTDDTAAIQGAFNQSKYIYFPEGKYIISKPLRFNFTEKNDHGAGGWISGEGRNKTTIVNSSGGSVFNTRGLAYSTISGITMVSKGHDAVVFSLENTNGIGHATQSNSFYNLGVIGGYKGIGIGEVSPTQCSENIFIDTVIKNTSLTSISVGSFNALANIFINLYVEDSDNVIGNFGDLQGGTWSIVDADFNNIRKNIHGAQGSSDGVYLYKGIRVADTAFSEAQNNAAPYSIYIDESRFDGVSFGFSSAGGLFVNDSYLKDVDIGLSGHMAENYFVLNNTVVEEIEVDSVNNSTYVDLGLLDE